MEYRPVTDDEIATRLAALGTNPLGLHADEDDFRISIAGVQEKTAFLRVDESMAAATRADTDSHIFKPAMKAGPDGADFSDTPWNEWLCLVLCRALGLETAKAEVRLFDGKPVIMSWSVSTAPGRRVCFTGCRRRISVRRWVFRPCGNIKAMAVPASWRLLEILNGAAAPYMKTA